MKKPPQRVRITAAGEHALAAQSFNEIADALHSTAPRMRSVYRRAIHKLRRNTEAVEAMRGLAAELERGRPVQFDWFGDEEETA